ncbi:nullo [Haematobia irritans]|uniref:nullo n=1 Tax=Haematobia irritans TaxID=7368 RepID=UPI003F4FDF4F
MGNVHTVNCVLAPEDGHNHSPGLMKRTYQRISFKRNTTTTSSNGSDKSSSSSIPSPLVSPKLSKSGKKRLVLKPMPRCSSFEDVSALKNSSKKPLNDPTYLLWKRAFEQHRPKPAAEAQSHWARMRRRVHNMSSAVSGHLTPKGFPAFVLKRRQSKSKKSMPNSPREIHNDNRVQIPQHLATKVTLTGTTISSVKTPLKGNPSSAVNKPKYTLAPLNLLSKLPQCKQAIIIEQLYRDIKEMESRYDDQMETFVL